MLTGMLSLALMISPAQAQQAPPTDTAPTAAEIMANHKDDPNDARMRYLRAKQVGEMARAGEYGRLTGNRQKQIEFLSQNLQEQLKGYSKIDEMPAAERSRYERTQADMDKMLASMDPNRVVCLKEQKTGSRILKEECMTVAARELRAKLHREMAGAMINREGCNPSDGKPCTPKFHDNGPRPAMDGRGM